MIAAKIGSTKETTAVTVYKTFTVVEEDKVPRDMVAFTRAMAGMAAHKD